MPSCLPSHRTSALFVLSASREGHPLQQQQLRFRPIFADFSPFLVLDSRLKLQRDLQDGLDHEARWRRVGEYLLFPGTDGNPSCGSSKSNRKNSGANLRSPSNLRRLNLLKSHFQEHLESSKSFNFNVQRLLGCCQGDGIGGSSQTIQPKLKCTLKQS